MYFEINFFFVSIVYFLENESLKVEAWDVALNWGGGSINNAYIIPKMDPYFYFEIISLNNQFII